MKRYTVTYYCDDCKKGIVTFDKESHPDIRTTVSLLEAGVFVRPGDDKSHLCRDCMLKQLDKWREEVSGH